MSVRRLAEINVQPPSFAFDEAFAAQADTWIAKYPEGRQQSAVIPLLMLAQEQEGWVTKAAIESIADMLRMPRIRALEVATFYTQFQLKPVGTKAHVQVCGTTPCMLRGSEALMDVCRDKIHHDQFHLNGVGTLSWEEVECLGACVNAPMVMIGKDAYEDLTPERLAEIIGAFEAGHGAAVPVGPQNGRTVSIPASGATSLTDESVFIEAARARREAREREANGVAEASAPPSKAAKPATDAIETNAAVKSPSPVKVGPAQEGAKASEAPPHDTKAANGAEPAVEAGKNERSGPIQSKGESAPYKAPELATKSQAAESGKVAEVGASVAAVGQPDRPLGDTQKPAAGVDDVGTAMGSAAEPSSGTPAPALSHAGGSNPVEISNSNTPRPGDDQMRRETEGGYASLSSQPPEHPDRPAGIVRPETPDDLKMISGVGPKIEATLHSLGIFTFRQIAEWNEAQRHWVDGYLRFHGRIERDDWVRQAQALAAGGEAEYVRVFGKKPR